ncbi:MAG: hypothetical protein KDB48_05075 [Solirubrobacterales bacterium]|nr:hypothetical protein [Solirubrobacterales bacterium]HMT04303.1 hypothetical protein [Solirubrobacterales bacterium]
MRERTGIGKLAGKSWVAPAILGVALVVWAVVIGSYRSHLGFLGDEWGFITMRLDGGPDAYLEPHNSNIVLLFMLIFRGLFEIFGLTHPFGFHVFAMLVYMTIPVVLFGYLRILVGSALALLAALVVLFLGACTDSLLLIFQFCFSISIAAGIAALLALRRGGRRWDIAACLLLVVSVLTVTLGVPFLVAAAVVLMLAPGTIRRSYVVLIPGLLFLIWYLGWGRGDAVTPTFDTVLATPEFIFDSFAYSLAVLTGTFRVEGWFGDIVPTLLAIAVIVLVVWRVWQQRRFPPELLVGLAAGISFWAMNGLSQDPDLFGLRNYDQNRYQLPSVIFTLMILGGAWAGVKPKAGFKVAFSALAVVAIWVNMANLSETYSKQMRPASDQALASMTALDLLGPEIVDPSTEVTIIPFGDFRISAATYFSLRDRFGPGGWDPSRVEAQPDSARLLVDGAVRMVRPYPVEKVVVRPPGPCRVLEPARDGETAAVPLDQVLYFRSNGKGVLKTGRFAEGEPAGIAYFGDYWVKVSPTDDSIETPWRINARSSEPVRVCPVTGPGTG